jgi:hypothetical protein
LLELKFQFTEETGLVILQVNKYFFPDYFIICNWIIFTHESNIKDQFRHKIYALN